MKNEYIIQDNDELFPGIPAGAEPDEELIKPRLSCSGTGRIEKNFGMKHLRFDIAEL